jgi:hypothetical protein
MRVEGAMDIGFQVGILLLPFVRVGASVGEGLSVVGVSTLKEDGAVVLILVVAVIVTVVVVVKDGDADVTRRKRDDDGSILEGKSMGELVVIVAMVGMTVGAPATVTFGASVGGEEVLLFMMTEGKSVDVCNDVGVGASIGTDSEGAVAKMGAMGALGEAGELMRRNLETKVYSSHFLSNDNRYIYISLGRVLEI